MSREAHVPRPDEHLSAKLQRRWLRGYTYNWLHIPTGARGKRTIELDSEQLLLHLLNEWNRSAPGNWQYWT